MGNGESSHCCCGCRRNFAVNSNNSLNDTREIFIYFRYLVSLNTLTVTLRLFNGIFLRKKPFL